MIQNSMPELEPCEVDEKPARTILIVDDDESQVMALSHRFESLGYRTMAAYEGKQGIEIAQTRHPDILLLDLRLPDMDGFDVCECITSSTITCDIPVIILSAMERSDIVRQTRAAGCKFFLKKPYDPNSLLVLVEQALRDSDRW